MQPPKTKPEYIHVTLSQDKKAWIGAKNQDGFYYCCQYGNRVLMYSKYLCAN